MIDNIELWPLYMMSLRFTWHIFYIRSSEESQPGFYPILAHGYTSDSQTCNTDRTGCFIGTPKNQVTWKKYSFDKKWQRTAIAADVKRHVKRKDTRFLLHSVAVGGKWASFWDENGWVSQAISIMEGIKKASETYFYVFSKFLTTHKGLFTLSSKLES